eukprot:g18854.t1
MRLLAFGRSNLHDGWFLFDIVLVGMGILGNIFGLIVASEGENAFGKILVVRSLRLLRLVRAIRMLHVFRTAWRLKSKPAEVSLMNLVTAVLVEGALANAANDKELSRHDLKLKVKKFAPKIMDVFSDMDVDSNGVIDRQELAKLNLSQLPFELNSTHVANMEDQFFTGEAPERWPTLPLLRC